MIEASYRWRYGDMKVPPWQMPSNETLKNADYKDRRDEELASIP